MVIRPAVDVQREAYDGMVTVHVHAAHLDRVRLDVALKHFVVDRGLERLGVLRSRCIGTYRVILGVQDFAPGPDHEVGPGH